jgi:hypothetical protein
MRTTTATATMKPLAVLPTPNKKFGKKIGLDFRKKKLHKGNFSRKQKQKQNQESKQNKKQK